MHCLLRSPAPGPVQVLSLEDECVAQVAAGGFASAAVSGSGRLSMWGTLLEQKVGVGG